MERELLKKIYQVIGNSKISWSAWEKGKIETRPLCLNLINQYSIEKLQDRVLKTLNKHSIP